MEIGNYQEFVPKVFGVLLKLLDGSSPLSPAHKDDVLTLLFNLDYRSSEAGKFYKIKDNNRADDEKKLLFLAQTLQRFFVARPPEAPGLMFCAGMLEPPRYNNNLAPALVSIGGIGASFASAFRRCIGEAAEYLAQIENDSENTPELHPQPVHKVLNSLPSYWCSRLTNTDAKRLDCVQAVCLNDDSKAYLPADLCLRRAALDVQLKVPYKLSTGCAAGPTYQAALCAAISEVVERDAVALWWYGGVPARQISKNQLQSLGIQDLMDDLRCSYRGRNTVLLDVSSDLAIPVAVAFSFDNSGGNFACGTAARLDMKQALQAALRELCQMELGLAFVALKIKQSGRRALNDVDKRQLKRAQQIKLKHYAALVGNNISSLSETDLDLNIEKKLEVLKQRFNHAGLKLYAVDLTRKLFGIPVVQAIIPALQATSPAIISNRLQAAIEQYGGGFGLKHNIDLY